MKNLYKILMVVLAIGFLNENAMSQQPEYYDTYNKKMKDHEEQRGTEKLSTESLEILSNMKLHVIPQTHIDLAWWWRYDPHTVDVVVTHTLETAFENMEKYPDYTFTFLQVPAIEPLEERYPELFYKMRYYVHYKDAIDGRLPNPGPSGSNGRLAIGSGVYNEIDGSLPCGEALVRQCVYGKRYFKHQFGIDVKNAWFQDAWTHPWTFPQILKKSGMNAYMYTRPRPEEKFMIVADSLKDEYLATYTNIQDDRMFWWESPDGSRVFAYKPLRIGGESMPSEKHVNEYLLEMNSKYGIEDGFTLVGVGNHGGGAIKADVERMRDVMQKKKEGEALAEIKFSTPELFVNEILEKPNNFPVVKYELFPTIRGIYTTVADVKKGNRYSENLILTLEKFASIADALDVHTYPKEWLTWAWEKIMLNQFHDTISGTDVAPSIDDALRRYTKIKDEGWVELNNSLKAIAGKINTEGDGSAVVVFNPLSWKRNAPVEAELILDEKVETILMTDNNGNSVPTQILEQKEDSGKFIVKVLFIAKVPSFGYTVYHASLDNSDTENNELIASKTELENEFFKVVVDETTGNLKSIFDKKSNREVLNKDEGGNLIQILNDYGDAEGFMMSKKGFGEYYLWPEKGELVEDVEEIKLVENGSTRITIQIKKKYNLARFTQRIHLYPGINRIDFELVMDWQGKNKMVKVAFPLSVESDSATYEIPYGTIKRASVGEEHVAQKWVDISDDLYGVSLLNDSRYGYDITSNTIRLSALRSPDHPVWATDEKGVHTIKYSLYPHQGSWQDGKTTQKGYEFNYPLIAVVEENHKGDLPNAHSFVSVEEDNVNLSVIKKAEDSDDIVLRLVETDGKNSSCNITISPFLKFNAVHKTDLLENEIEIVPYKDQTIQTEAGKYSIESYKVIKDTY